jgi:hypothetical protein
MGRSSQALLRRRVSGDTRGQAPASIGGGAANVAGQTNVAASLDDREAAERFSATVLPFSAADLARAARRTKAAAKGWKDASRAPSLASTLNMARNIPAVRKWLLHELGEVAEFDDPRVLAAAVILAQHLKP